MSRKARGARWRSRSIPLIEDLLRPTAEVTRAIAGVAQGNLTQTVRLDVDGRPLEGEFLRSANIVNTSIGFIPFAGIGWRALKTLTKDDSSPVRAAAAKVLAKDPDPATTEALADALEDKSWLVRAAALEALSMRADPSVLAKVEPLLSDEKEAVKSTAAATDRNQSYGNYSLASSSRTTAVCMPFRLSAKAV